MNDPSRPNTRQPATDSLQGAPQASGGPESARGATDAAGGRRAPSVRQPAYDAVFAYIREQPREETTYRTAVRNAHIWRAVDAALDAMGVGTCVASHCVENDHITTAPRAEGDPA